MNYAVAMRRSKGKRKSKSWENDYDANRTCSTYFQGKKASSSAVGYEFISFGTIIGFVCLVWFGLPVCALGYPLEPSGALLNPTLRGIVDAIRWLDSDS